MVGGEPRAPDRSELRVASLRICFHLRKPIAAVIITWAHQSSRAYGPRSGYAGRSWWRMKSVCPRICVGKHVSPGRSYCMYIKLTVPGWHRGEGELGSGEPGQ